MDQDNNMKNMNDHDLLIVIHTTVSHLITDMRDLKDNTLGRVANLELEKHNKEDAEKRYISSDGIHKDHELRLRLLERWGATAVGALFIIELVLKYFIK